ncbi:MAG: serine hydrolase domain-containing protein [Bacteroidota bacterium]
MRNYFSLLVSVLLLSVFLLAVSSTYAQIQTADGKNINTHSLDRFIQSQMKSHDVPGLSFALINNGKLVYHASYGVQNTENSEPVTDTTIFEAASISKSVFAGFAMMMVERGVLDLDTPLHTYLPEPLLEYDNRYKMITSRMVLSHMSGLPNWRFFNEDGQLDIKFTPGTDFHYSGEGYEYLARVLAHIHGVDYHGLEQVIKEQLYTPLEMNNSGFRLSNEKLKVQKAVGYEDGIVSEGIPSDLARPYFGAAFRFHTTASDFSKWMIALMENRMIDRKTTDEMFRNQVVLPEDESLRTENGFDSWGLGVMRVDTPLGIKIAHGGMNPSFQGYYMMFKEEGFGIFGNSNTAIDIVPAVEEFLIHGSGNRD